MNCVNASLESTRNMTQNKELCNAVHPEVKSIDEKDLTITLPKSINEGLLDMNAQTEESDLPMSKKKMKKLARQKKWEETKLLRRQKDRVKQKLRKQKKREELEKALTEGSITEFPEPRKRIKMEDPEASQISVVIDCSFDHLMTEADVSKVTKQIQRCYTNNRHSPTPFQFYISSFGGATKDSFTQRIIGYMNWDAHVKECPLDQIFSKECIVYLSSESPNILTELDPTKAYVIGGLVDHNHHKGHCYQQAVERGWVHAQLPISDYVKLNSRKVLTVNQVFEILSAFMIKNSWEEAFYHVLPQRKVKQFLKPIEKALQTPSQNNSETESFSQTILPRIESKTAGDTDSDELSIEDETEELDKLEGNDFQKSLQTPTFPHGSDDASCLSVKVGVPESL